MGTTRMTDLWDEKPKFADYDSVMWEEYLDARDAWLEKLKVEWDAILKHHVTQEEGYELQIRNMEEQEKAYMKCIDFLKEKAEKWERIQDSPYLAHDDPDFIIGEAEFQFERRKKMENKIEALEEEKALWNKTYDKLHDLRVEELKKLEAIKTFLKETSEDRVWSDWFDIEYAKEALKILEGKA